MHFKPIPIKCPKCEGYNFTFDYCSEIDYSIGQVKAMFVCESCNDLYEIVLHASSIDKT